MSPDEPLHIGREFYDARDSLALILAACEKYQDHPAIQTFTDRALWGLYQIHEIRKITEATLTSWFGERDYNLFTYGSIGWQTSPHDTLPHIELKLCPFYQGVRTELTLSPRRGPVRYHEIDLVHFAGTEKMPIADIFDEAKYMAMLDRVLLRVEKTRALYNALHL